MGWTDISPCRGRDLRARRGGIMTIGHYRVIKWALTAGAFVSIVATVTGCSKMMSALHLKWDDEPKASRNVVETVQRTPSGNDDDQRQPAPTREQMMTSSSSANEAPIAPKV